MKNLVDLVHPDLPGRVLTVRESAARTYRGAGWTDKPATEPGDASTSTEDTALSQTQSRRGRATKNSKENP